MAYQAAGHAARRPRRQGIWHRLVARLGRQGHHPARRPRRHRRKLRAHPPLEPRRHGRAPAPVPRRRERRHATASTAARPSRSPASQKSSRARTSPSRSRAPTARPSTSSPAAASIPITSSNITAPAGSSTTSCGTSPHDARPVDGSGRLDRRGADPRRLRLALGRQVGRQEPAYQWLNVVGALGFIANSGGTARGRRPRSTSSGSASEWSRWSGSSGNARKRRRSATCSGAGRSGARWPPPATSAQRSGRRRSTLSCLTIFSYSPTLSWG